MTESPKCLICKDKGLLKRDYEFCKCPAGQKLRIKLQKDSKRKGFVY